MVIRAIQYVRGMRGGSEPHLLLGDDDQHYVVKFFQNPQHPHVLVNEVVAHSLLGAIGLPTPDWTVVDVPAFVIEQVRLHQRPETKRRGASPAAGLHFGSRYVGRPTSAGPYEYLPLNLLLTVENLADFYGVLAFDKWACNLDGRQALFRRERAGPRRSPSWRAWMIDHGFTLGGPHWRFDDDSPEQGLYVRREVYAAIRGYESFEPWLSRIVACPQRVLDRAYDAVPPDWIGERSPGLERVVAELYERRSHAPELLYSAKRSARDPFPGWTRNRSYRGPDFAGTA